MSDETEHSPWLLQAKPTADRWRVELDKIVEGSREADLQQFGSPAAYVRSLIFNSCDDSVARALFERTLDRLVASWHPLDWPGFESDPRNLRILQLLAAYTPAGGMAKTLKLLRPLNTYEPRSDELMVPRMKSLALQVMERYFPAEQDPAGAFAEYVEQLELNLANPTYALYAASRLRELRRLRVVSEVRKVAECDLTVLSQLVPVFLSGLAPAEGVRVFSQLRIQFQGAPPAVLAALKEVALSHGLHLDDSPAAPTTQILGTAVTRVSEQYRPAEDNGLRLAKTLFKDTSQRAATETTRVRKDAHSEFPPPVPLKRREGMATQFTATSSGI
ncbi:MAG TPA: hypothetical protein VGH73_05865 [Thermoanaerobaculia bacterium]|jgi:hypothetical protein